MHKNFSSAISISKLFELTTHKISYWDKDRSCIFASKPFLEWSNASSVTDLNTKTQNSKADFDYFKPSEMPTGELHYYEVEHGSANYRVSHIPDDSEGEYGFLMEVENLFLDRSEVKKESAETSKWKTIVQNTPDALVIADEDGQIEYINSKSEELFGYTPEELVGKPVECLMPTKFRKAHPAKRNSYAKSPHPRSLGNLLLSGLKKDGTEFPVDVSLSPMQTSDGLLNQRFHSNIDGHGLGLFIIKTQLEAMGGTITAEGEEGKGCKFVIFIPSHGG